ncbi:hypothetical protein HAL1_09597 [Halomonas sp. HAL1]|nr:hypothetical protein HAL1_09597 [Halomonas sp. HAL1]
MENGPSIMVNAKLSTTMKGVLDWVIEARGNKDVMMDNIKDMIPTDAIKAIEQKTRDTLLGGNRLNTQPARYRLARLCKRVCSKLF